MNPGPIPRSRCPIVFALDLFGDRWTLVVIRDLALKGLSSYGELQNGGESIATNVLADRLKRLTVSGIVTKEPDPEHGAKIRYRLTQKGLDLIPVLVEMMRWSAQHDPESPVSRTLQRELARTPQAVAKRFLKRARELEQERDEADG